VEEELKRISALKVEMVQFISRNEALRDELIDRQAKIDAANNKQVKKLAKMYEAMAPDEAAPILDTMNEKVALTLFDAMKGKAAAGIMEFMPDKKAARLGEKLAKPK